MGCDIHAYVEYKYNMPDEKEHWWDFADLHISRNYRLFALAATVRMYDWFAQREQLAKVLKKHGIPPKANDEYIAALPDEKRTALLEDVGKCDGDTGITMGQEPFKPKGIPRPLSYHVESKYTLFVYDDENHDEYGCSRESAEGWVEGKSSTWWDDDKHRVTNPDWHTPSWLSTAEVVQLLERMEAAQRACIPAAKKRQAEMVQMAKDYEEKHPDKSARKDLQSWKFHDPMNDEALTELRAIVGIMKALEEKKGSEARLVFWFDN